MKVKVGILVILVSLFLSCAVKYSQSHFLEIEEVSEIARKRGLNLPNPFEISEQIKKEVEKEIPLNQPPNERFRKILPFILKNGGIKYDNDIHINYTAEEAYFKKRGNCLSFTGLFAAIARHLNLPVYFAYLTDLVDFEEKEGSYIVSSHIAAGFQDGTRTLLVDFTNQGEKYKLYEKVDDLTAYAFFYNNVAVGKIFEGKFEEASEILSFLLSIKPSLKEVLNNKGVLFIKMGKYRDALTLFDEMRQKKLNFQPALHNGLLAAKLLKDTYYEQIFIKELKEYGENDPLILYQKGIDLAKEGKLKEGIDFIKRAIAFRPRSAFLYASLSILYLKNGDLQKAKEAYKKAKKISEDLFLLQDIAKEYPEITK